MFSLKRRRAFVQHQWIVPMEEFQSDVGLFYSAIEETIHERQLPPMRILRIPWREGGLLSTGREYLRIMRERLIFDIGCGPFGSYWFYSCRGAVITRRMTWLDVLFALVMLFSFWSLYIVAFGLIVGSVVFGLTLTAVFRFMGVAGKWPGMDEALIHMPVVGVIYETLFRRQTYYRQDIRQMWLTVIHSIVREKVKEFVKAGGGREPQFIDVPDPDQPEGIRDLAGTLLREFAEDTKEVRAAIADTLLPAERKH